MAILPFHVIMVLVFYSQYVIASVVGATQGQYIRPQVDMPCKDVCHTKMHAMQGSYIQRSRDLISASGGACFWGINKTISKINTGVSPHHASM